LPAKVRSGKLLEEVRIGLEQHRIGKTHDASGWLACVLVSGEFHQGHLEEPDLKHITVDASDLNTVTGFDSVAATYVK
jgi:hypothetical protein